MTYTKVSFRGKLLSALRKVFSISHYLYSVCFPKLHAMDYPNEGSKLDDSQRLLFVRKLESSLKNNTSFALEPEFRIRILDGLSDWIMNQASFEDTKTLIAKAISQRPFFARAFIPSTGFREAVSSAGFFTMLIPSTGRPSSWRSFGLESLVLKASLLANFGVVKIRPVLKDMKLSRRAFEGSYSRKSLSFFRGQLHEAVEEHVHPGRACLIVGPSYPDLGKVDSWEGMRFLLVTPSFDMEVLAGLIERYGAIPVLNNVSAAEAIRGRGQLLRLLKKAPRVFVAPSFVDEFVSECGVSASSFQSNFLRTWDTGSPNLLHRAIGVALPEVSRIEITGANLYSGTRIYGQVLGGTTGLRERPTRSLHQFFTCLSYSNHDPIANFISIKRLFESGLIGTSDESLNTVLRGTLRDYLESLETSLGRTRK